MPMYINSNNLASQKPKSKGFCYGKKTRHNDKITGCFGKNCFENHTESLTGLFRKAFQARFYTSSTVYDFDPQTVLPDRLSRNHSTAKRLAGVAENAQTGQAAALHNSPEGPPAAAKKRAFERLQTIIFKYAAQIGLIQKTAEASAVSIK